MKQRIIFGSLYIKVYAAVCRKREIGRGERRCESGFGTFLPRSAHDGQKKCSGDGSVNDCTVAGWKKTLKKVQKIFGKVNQDALSLQSLSDFRKARSKAASVPRSGVENRKFFFENIVL